MMLWLILPLAFIASFALTAVLRAYALQRSLIDVPNARSSHSVPTPRGGGVAIVLVVAVLLSILAGSGLADMSLAWAVLGAGSAVAVLGFVDDHGHIAARWRLLGHFMAAAWALFWLGGCRPCRFWVLRWSSVGWGICWRWYSSFGCSIFTTSWMVSMGSPVLRRFVCAQVRCSVMPWPGR